MLSNNRSRRQLQTGIHINMNLHWHTAAINYRNSHIQSHKIKRIARFCILRLLITDKCYAKIADICIWSTTALYQTLLKFKHTLPHAHTYTLFHHIPETFFSIFAGGAFACWLFFHFSHSFSLSLYTMHSSNSLGCVSQLVVCSNWCHYIGSAKSKTVTIFIVIKLTSLHSNRMSQSCIKGRGFCKTTRLSTKRKFLSFLNENCMHAWVQRFCLIQK